MAITAYSYRRISSSQQKQGTKRGDVVKTIDSLDTQELNANKWVEKQPSERNIVLDDTLDLEEVVSGSTGQNVAGGALGIFLDHVTEGTIPTPCYLLIDTWSRFSRQSPFKQIQLFADVVDQDVTIVTLNDEVEYTKEKCEGVDALATFMPLIVKMAESSGVSDMASRSGKLTWARRIQATIDTGVALTARCPAWLYVDKKTKKYCIHEEHAALVKRIFKLAIEGHGNVAIARKLNEEKIKTFTNKGIWHDGSIARLLSNEAVIGWHNFKERRRETNFKPVSKSLDSGDTRLKIYPVVVSEYDYQRVRDIRRDKTPKWIKAQTRRTTATNIFSYLLRCGYYGCSMRHRSSTGERAGVYNSNDWFHKRKPSYDPAWKVEALEDAFVEYLYKWKEGYGNKQIANIPEQEKKFRNKVQVIKTDIEQLDNVIKTYWNDLDDTNIQQEMRQRIMERITAKEKDKNKLVQKSDAANENLVNYLAQASTDDKSKSLLSTFSKNRKDLKYKKELNAALKTQIKTIDLYGGGLKYDKKRFNSQLKNLESYIRKQEKDPERMKLIMVEKRPLPDECPELSTDLWVGLNQDTYSNCFYIYEIFWQIMIGKYVPSDYQADAYKLLKRIPNDDKDNRFFVVQHRHDPFKSIDDWSSYNDYQTIVKPKEIYGKRHTAICKGLEWVGEWDSIWAIEDDADNRWTPLYYCTIGEGNPIIQIINKIDNTLDFGRVSIDGKWDRSIGRLKGKEVMAAAIKVVNDFGAGGINIDLDGYKN